MQLSKEEINKITLRISKIRTEFLLKNRFYGLLLSHLSYGLDFKTETAYTNGKKICFSPSFLNKISDSELEFVIMHELLHVVFKHCNRSALYNQFLFNVAADIVVNSNILRFNNMLLDSITIKFVGGPLMHTTPKNDEGYLYSAEEVYKMLLEDPNISKLAKSNYLVIDDHSKWEKDEDNSADWDAYIIEAYKNSKSTNQCGKLPLAIERIIENLINPKVNWKAVLNNFIIEEINDYSFSPPDKRYDNSDFFLPDFNEPIDTIKNILFMIDTSGSMSIKQISECFNEIKGAVEQFSGRLEGKLGFFDAKVIPPVSFNSFSELKLIKAYGGGGTSFNCIFDYIFKEMINELPSAIIILTDGYAPIPNEEIRKNIPVLWIINNKEVTPKWGKIIRI